MSDAIPRYGRFPIATDRKRPKAVVRPAALNSVGSTAQLITASNWINCSQAAPSTPQTLNPSTLYVYSNNYDSYDSTSIGYKFAVKFDTATSLKKLSGLIAPVLSFESGARFGHIGQVTYNSFTSGAETVNAYIRVRAITSNFTVSTLTWNGLSGLTIGDTLLEQTVACTGLQLQPSGAVSVENYNASDDGIYGTEMPFLLSTSNSTTVYGLLFDCKCHVGHVGIPSGMTITGSVATGSIVNITSKPVLLVPLVYS